MIILSIIIFYALAYLKIDKGMCLALSVLVFVVYWVVHNWQDIKNNETTYYDEDETSTNSKSSIKETENDNNCTTLNTKEIKHIMGTKDLCLQLLQKMNIDVHADEDDENTYIFEYKGETVSVRMSNENAYIVLHDLFFRKFPANNLEMVSIVCKAVNNANIKYNGFKLFYSFIEDTMWIHSELCELLRPEIHDVESFFRNDIDCLIYSHKAFEEELFELMKNEVNKETNNYRI